MDSSDYENVIDETTPDVPSDYENSIDDAAGDRDGATPEGGPATPESSQNTAMNAAELAAEKAAKEAKARHAKIMAERGNSFIEARPDNPTHYLGSMQMLFVVLFTMVKFGTLSHVHRHELASLLIDLVRTRPGDGVARGAYIREYGEKIPVSNIPYLKGELRILLTHLDQLSFLISKNCYPWQNSWTYFVYTGLLKVLCPTAAKGGNCPGMSSCKDAHSVLTSICARKSPPQIANFLIDTLRKNKVTRISIPRQTAVSSNAPSGARAGQAHAGQKRPGGTPSVGPAAPKRRLTD